MIRFNQTWRFGNPLPVSAEGLPNTNVRDVSIKAISLHLPAYSDVVNRLLAQLPAKRYQLVSISAQTLRPGQESCVDTGWHLDGKMCVKNPEHYSLVCFGDDGNRTLFSNQRLMGLIETTPASIDERKALFSSLLKRDLENESEGIEIPNGVPVTYTTFDFHKGRRALSADRRVLRSGLVGWIIWVGTRV